MIRRWKGNKYELISETHYNPNHGKNLKAKYQLEYTDKDELIKEDYSNLKTVEGIADLQHLTELIFEMRERGKHNINAYYIVENKEGNWLIEDYCNDIETYSNTTQEKQAKKRIEELENIVASQNKEIEQYREFLKKYNAIKQYEIEYTA